jgi:hypothetical protein
MSKLTSPTISKTFQSWFESPNANQTSDNGIQMETSFKDMLTIETRGLCRLTRGITSKLVSNLVMTSAHLMETFNTLDTFTKDKVQSLGMLLKVAGLTNQCFNNQIDRNTSPLTWTLLYAHQHNG